MAERSLSLGDSDGVYRHSIAILKKIFCEVTWCLPGSNKLTSQGLSLPLGFFSGCLEYLSKSLSHFMALSLNGRLGQCVRGGHPQMDLCQLCYAFREKFLKYQFC